MALASNGKSDWDVSADSSAQLGTASVAVAATEAVLTTSSTTTSSPQVRWCCMAATELAQSRVAELCKEGLGDKCEACANRRAGTPPVARRRP